MNTYTPLKNFLSLLFVLLSIPVFAQSGSIEDVTTSLRSDLIVEGESLWTLPDRMTNYKIPGISIAVVQDFELVGARSYGKVQADLPKQPTTETAFQAASISKLVNAVGIMKLVEAGKLDLDQDINTILTTWKLPPSLHHLDDIVTTRMLLAHTAGLSTHGFGGYKSAEGLPSAIEILDKVPGVNSTAVQVFKKPGESFKYSGGGTVITQLIIEELTGMSYTDYMQKTVLKPLGMTNSFYSVNQKGRENQLATAHWTNGKPLKGKYHYYPESAPAGLWSTPTDLSKIMIDMMLAIKGEEGRLLSPATAQAMLVPPIKGENNALGLFLRNKDGHIYFNHGGSNEGFKANFIGSTSTGNGAIIMHNGEQYDLIPEVLNAIAHTYSWPSWFGPESIISPNLVVDKSIWKSYKGHYVNKEKPKNTFDISIKKGKLQMSRGKEWNLPLIAISANKYLLKGANPSVTVEFLADGRLKVTQGEVSFFQKEKK